MAFPVTGRSAIVTGAGSVLTEAGINLSFARLLLENGCNVLIADLALRPEAKELVDKHAGASEPNSGRAVFQQTDVTDWKQLDRMFEVAEKEFGELDLVCPGAGVYEPHWSNFWRPPGTPDSKDDPSGGRYALIDINITHPIRVTQLAISHFLRFRDSKKPRHVIHISSVAGQNASFPNPMYSATKHAISGFVRSMAYLDEMYGIRVTAVAPGIIKTPLWTDHPEKLKMINDSDTWVTADEVAEVMLALVQQNKVSEVIGASETSNEGKLFDVEGGTILEVSKKVRNVAPFNDPGPGTKPGAVATHGDTVTEETIGLLNQDGWGVRRAKI